MWHYFPRRPLENRVLKTRFIIQKNFKNLQVPHLTGSDQNRERLRSERGRPDKREREIVRSERERKRSRGSRTWVWARPESRDPSRGLLLRFFFFFLLLALFSWLVLFRYIWALNRVFKTRFLNGQHVENDATSDVIRPWKSSLKDSIYGSKSSVLDSNG